MDPVSTVGLIGSCLSVANGAFATINNVRSLIQSYSQAKQRINLISGQINTVCVALSSLENWARKEAAETTLASPTGASFEQSIHCCVLIISAISEHVSACQSMGVRQRVKYLFNESKLDGFGRSLKDQISALQLLVSAIHL